MNYEQINDGAKNPYYLENINTNINNIPQQITSQQNQRNIKYFYINIIT